jgi:hypothetical protein
MAAHPNSYIGNQHTLASACLFWSCVLAVNSLVAEASGLFYPITWLVGCFIGTESFDDYFNTSSSASLR